MGSDTLILAMLTFFGLRYSALLSPRYYSIIFARQSSISRLRRHGATRALLYFRSALHVIQRGNNREAIFFANEDYTRYREWLLEAASEHKCAIHAYVLMTNHVHLLATPEAEGSLSKVMQSLGRRYVGYVN